MYMYFKHIYCDLEPIFFVKNVNFLEFIRKEWNLGKSIVICTMWMLGWRMKGKCQLPWLEKWL
jgi:hypothetical protein